MIEDDSLVQYCASIDSKSWHMDQSSTILQTQGVTPSVNWSDPAFMRKSKLLETVSSNGSGQGQDREVTFSAIGEDDRGALQLL